MGSELRYTNRVAACGASSPHRKNAGTSFFFSLPLALPMVTTVASNCHSGTSSEVGKESSESGSIESTASSSPATCPIAPHNSINTAKVITRDPRCPRDPPATRDIARIAPVNPRPLARFVRGVVRAPMMVRERRTW